MRTPILTNFDKRKSQQHILGRALRQLSNRGNTEIRALCLPGETAFDIKYFLTYPHVSEIVCLETDVQIFEKLQQEFAEDRKVKLLNTSTTRFLDANREPFDLVYLDYFTNLSSMVRTDLELLMRHNQLRHLARLVVNFYGARETSHDSVQNRIIYEDFCKRYGEEPRHSNTPSLRMASYNALLWAMIMKYKTQMTVPEWWKYNTDGGEMCTAVSIRRSGKGHQHIWSNLKHNRTDWFFSGEVKKPSSGRFFVTRMNGKETKLEMIKWQIKDFHEKHGRTPSCRELPLAYPNNPITNAPSVHYSSKYNEIVRSLGFLPTKGRTPEDWKTELKRLHSKDGYLSWSSNLKEYYNNSGETWKLIKKVSVEIGLPIREEDPAYHDFVAKVVHYIYLTGFINDQKKGLCKSNCFGYVYMHAYGISHLSFIEHTKELDKLQLWIKSLPLDQQEDFHRLSQWSVQSLKGLMTQLSHKFGKSSIYNRRAKGDK